MNGEVKRTSRLRPYSLIAIPCLDKTPLDRCFPSSHFHSTSPPHNEYGLFIIWNLAHNYTEFTQLFYKKIKAILGVYDFLLSDKYNLELYKKKCPGSSKLFNGSEWWLRFWSPPKKLHPSIIKSAPQGSGGLIKAFWSESLHLCKKNIHI